MRKLIAIEFVTLDGVIQGCGGPDEDPSGGFNYGGWLPPFSDPILSEVMKQQMSLPFDLLLGRKTFEIWAPYWPKQDFWPAVNSATKYVASNTLSSHDWQPSVFLSGDVATHVQQLKQQPGPDLHLYGSANLLQTLLKGDLVDEMWLKIFPITLGSGKRLFAQGSIPARFEIAQSQISTKGVFIANYRRTGSVKTGSFQ